MQLEEFQDLKLSKRQYNRLARTVLDKHRKKEAEERRSLEAKARTYSVQDLQEALKGTDAEISEEETYEVVNERYGKSSGISQKLSKIGLGVAAACGAVNLTGAITCFSWYAFSGKKEQLIAGIAQVGFVLYSSYIAYKNYKEIRD